MSEINVKSIDSVAFAVLVVFLIASGTSGILGFVVFVHTPYLVLFTILLAVFLIMAIVLSFIKK
ncbi:MAG: hypothetical protein M8349_03285 [ANME-2 cluster archaeon]|nr:hypothetical protein [ANME-2 cluster archaeon]MDF1558379.1 hypothetical protein [ANME-2 cluster archaeon]